MSVETASIRTVNPATGDEIAAHDEHTVAEIERAIADAHAATWTMPRARG